jgi:single stranded DNA-binding protein
MGYLGQNPKVLKATKENHFIRLSLATNRDYTKKNGEHCQDVQWHTVYLSSKSPWAAETLKEGNHVFVVGELRHLDWKDKNGQKRYDTGVYSRKITLLDAKPQKEKAVIESLDEEAGYDETAEEENRWVSLDLFCEENSLK